MRTLVFALSATALLMAGCSDDDDKVCTPGVTQPCTCPGGKTGAQTCEKDGSSWGKCEGCGTTSSDKGVVNKDGGGSTDSAGCTKTGDFCSNGNIVKCSGNKEVPVKVCGNEDYESVKFGCEMCSSGAKCVPTKAMMTIKSTGVFNYSVSFKTPSCLPTSTLKQFNASGFGHFAHNLKTSSGQFSVSSSAMDLPNSTSLPMFTPKGGTYAFKVTFISGTKSCDNRGSNAPTSPPSSGTITISQPEAKKRKAGAPFTLKVDGYLTCDKGKTWEKIVYEAQGVFISNTTF